MTTAARAAAVLLALAVVLAARVAPGASATAPRSGGLSITIILPVNGTAVKGDVTISGNASGPDGVALSVQLSIDGGTWYAADGGRDWSWLWSTFAFQDGLHTVKARVQGGGGEATDTATYPVRNEKPDFTLKDIFPPGDDLHFKAGDVVEFSVAIVTNYTQTVLVNWSLDGNVVKSSEADRYNFTAGAGEPGNHTVEVRIIANDAVEASHSWNLTVRALALPPVVIGFGPADRNITVFRDYAVRFNVTATDPQDRGLTYRWSYDLAPAPGNATDGSTELLFNSTGTHIVEVLVSNGETNRTVRWNITVEELPALGLLDIAPCAAYIVIGLFLGIWHGRRTREEEGRKAQGARLE